MPKSWASRPPVRIPAVGSVLRLDEDDYMYGTGDLTLRVERVREDLSVWYDGNWVWVEGFEVLRNGQIGDARSALVRCAALPAPGRGVRRAAAPRHAAQDQAERS